MAKVAVYGLIYHKGRYHNLDNLYGPYEKIEDAIYALKQRCETPNNWKQMLGFTVGIYNADKSKVEEYALVKDSAATETQGYNFELKSASVISVETETDQRERADIVLDTKITAEEARAIVKETGIAENLVAEITRATSAEATLTTNLTNEITRSTTADSDLLTAIETLDKNKLDILGAEAGSGQLYKFPYNFNAPVYTDTGLTCTFDTITLDKNSSGDREFNSYTIPINAVTTTTAGLMTADDKNKLENKLDKLSNITVGTYTGPINVPVFAWTSQAEDKININYYTVKLDGTNEVIKRENELSLPCANSTSAGLLSKNDKVKLDAMLPDISGTDGTYILKAVKTGANINYTWEWLGSGNIDIVGTHGITVTVGNTQEVTVDAAATDIDGYSSIINATLDTATHKVSIEGVSAGYTTINVKNETNILTVISVSVI